MRRALALAVLLAVVAVAASAAAREWPADLVCDPVYRGSANRDLVAKRAEVEQIVDSLRRLENVLVSAAELTWTGATAGTSERLSSARERAHKLLDRAIEVCFCREAWRSESRVAAGPLLAACSRPIEEVRSRLLGHP